MTADLASLIASAQRRTTTRRAAHRLVVRALEDMGLSAHEELRLRDAAYRQIFPEYAQTLTGENPAMGTGNDDA